MNGISRLIWPQLKRFWRLYLSLMLIASLGVGCLTGLLGAYYAVKDGLDNYISDYQLNDITVYLSPSLKSSVNMEKISSVTGVKYECLRMTADFGAESYGRVFSVRLLSVDEDSFMKSRVIQSSKPSKKYINGSVTPEFAEDNGLSVGSVITVSGYGVEQRIYIEKIITNPECICVKPDSYIWAETSDFGFVYLSEEDMESLGFEGLFNQLIILSDGKSDLDEICDNVEALLPDTVLYSEKYEDSSVCQNISDNIDPLKSLSSTVPLIFFAVTALMTVLCSYRIVTKRKREIGILLMMGYTKRNISFLFEAAALITSLVSVLTGAVIGKIIACYAYYSYGNNFHLEYHTPSLPVNVLLSSSFIIIVLFLVTTYITVRFSAHSMTPINAITDTTDIGTCLHIKHGSVRTKIFFQRFLHHYRHNLTAVVCMAAVVMLVFCACSFYSSKHSVMNDFFERRIDYDAAVYLKTDTLSPSFNLPYCVTYYETALTAVTEIQSKDGLTASVMLQGIKPDSNAVHFLDANRNVISLPENGILLEKHTAEKLNVKVGDSVIIGDTEFLISALSDQSVNRISYLPFSAMKNTDIAFRVVLLCRTKDRDEFYHSIRTDSDFSDSLRQAAEHASRVTDVGIYLLISVSVLLGFITVVQIKEMNFDDERFSLAVKRTMGFSYPSIGFELMCEDAIRLVVASSAGIFLGRILARNILDGMETSSRAYPYCDSIIAYSVSILSVVLFLLLSHVCIMHRLKNIRLSSVIKSKE